MRDFVPLDHGSSVQFVHLLILLRLFYQLANCYHNDITCLLAKNIDILQAEFHTPFISCISMRMKGKRSCLQHGRQLAARPVEALVKNILRSARMGQLREV